MKAMPNYPQPLVTNSWNGASPSSLLTYEACLELSLGAIPDLEQVCYDLYHTFLEQRAPYSAMQFIPVLKKLNAIGREEAERFLKNPQGSHILVQNALIKIVLIHWRPGKVSSIHGHPKGGCVFKVLQGSLEEKRYSPDESKRLLAASTVHSGGMAYIDDNMAYHAVGNPFNTSAISLHVYTPACAKIRGYSENDLMDGITIVGSTAIHEPVKQGAAVLTF